VKSTTLRKKRNRTNWDMRKTKGGIMNFLGSSQGLDPIGILGLIIIQFGNAMPGLLKGRISKRFRYAALCAVVGLTIIFLGALVYMDMPSNPSPILMLPGETSLPKVMLCGNLTASKWTYYI
jgi:hypothetical protein